MTQAAVAGLLRLRGVSSQETWTIEQIEWGYPAAR
jgi:hypothetical protein